MPKDLWLKARQKYRGGPTHERQREGEASHDAATDRWVARREAHLELMKRQRRAKKARGK